MFRYNAINNTWEPYRHKVTYTQTLEAFDDLLEGYPEDAAIEDIVLTPDQKERLASIREPISMDLLVAFVMDDADIPGVDGYRKALALETLIDTMSEEMVMDNLEAVTKLAKAWQEETDYKENERLNHRGILYRVRQDHTSQRHQPPDLEGMLAIYVPYNPPGSVADDDPTRDLAANPYYVGELVRFPYGVYECLRITNFSPQEYAPDWTKRDDLI